MNTVDILLEMDENKLEKDTKKVRVSSLSEKAGKDIFFTIQELGNDEFKTLQDPCITKKRHGKVDFDENKYRLAVLQASILEPNLKEQKLLDKFKVHTPKDLLLKILKAGEIKKLYDEIENISGFDEDDEEENKEVEEVKN